MKVHGEDSYESRKVKALKQKATEYREDASKAYQQFREDNSESPIGDLLSFDFFFSIVEYLGDDNINDLMSFSQTCKLGLLTGKAVENAFEAKNQGLKYKEALEYMSLNFVSPLIFQRYQENRDFPDKFPETAIAMKRKLQKADLSQFKRSLDVLVDHKDPVARLWKLLTLDVSSAEYKNMYAQLTEQSKDTTINFTLLMPARTSPSGSNYRFIYPEIRPAFQRVHASLMYVMRNITFNEIIKDTSLMNAS